MTSTLTENTENVNGLSHCKKNILFCLHQLFATATFLHSRHEKRANWVREGFIYIYTYTYIQYISIHKLVHVTHTHPHQLSHAALSINKDFLSQLRQKRKQRSSLLFGGRNSFNSMPHNRFSTRMIWRKGWREERTLGKIDASEKSMIIRCNFLCVRSWP